MSGESPEWIIIHSRLEPYPLDSGAHQRIWELARFLRRHFRTGLVVHEGNLKWEKELGGAFDRVWCPSRLYGPSFSFEKWLFKVWSSSRKIGGQQPFTQMFSDYASNPMVRFDPLLAAFIDRLYRQVKPVAVLAEYIWAAIPPLPIAASLGIKAILDTHDVMCRRIASQRNLGMTPQFDLSEDEEIQLLRTAQAVIAIQPDEGKVLSAMVPDRRVIIAEHPVEVGPLPQKTQESHLALFVGSRAQHNVEGICRFIEDQWPIVLASIPQARLRIVGSVCELLPESLRQVSNVFYAGVVENLAEEYARASIVINPLRFGSGLKIKSVEALAHGKAMVSTPLGIEGMEEVAQKAFLCVPFEDMGKTVAELLRSPAQQARLGAEAAAFAKIRFSPERCFSELLKFIQSVL